MTEPASSAFVPAPAGAAPASQGPVPQASVPQAPAQFGATLDVMAQAAAHVGTVNEEIATLLATLLAQLEPIASTWKGAASGAFQNLHQRWNADARKLNAALGGIAESLSGTHRRYTAAEESNTTAVNRVAGLIG
ncbi:WXG100 family type VII secretion target [Catenulispora sp. GP43]|uniref:WXG100 family type VII secretion target n=1 Tax=Catenulispora sp. GP43 TaxID=3156263 RepID=UPI0035170636